MSNRTAILPNMILSVVIIMQLTNSDARAAGSAGPHGTHSVHEGTPAAPVQRNNNRKIFHNFSSMKEVTEVTGPTDVTGKSSVPVLRISLHEGSKGHEGRGHIVDKGKFSLLYLTELIVHDILATTVEHSVFLKNELKSCPPKERT